MKKPKVSRAGCLTCLYSNGEPYKDEKDKDITRIYCKARHVQVDMDIMDHFCDHFKLNPTK